MNNILIACTGSVATIKLSEIIKNLKSINNKINIRVLVTNHAKHFIKQHEISSDIEIYEDKDEWAAWSERGDPVLHIELMKWAHLMLIAPLDANTLAKIANGLCDNLVTCVVRAWDLNKPLIFCPAMNTKMYQHPLTEKQIDILVSWGYKHIPVIEKTLMCGDTGAGAMAEVNTIVEFVKNYLKLYY